MSNLNSSSLESHALPTGSYGFSAQKLDDLGSSEYTLATILADDSSSVSSFIKEMTECVKNVLNACKFSPRADCLMIRVVTFNSSLHEFHGFKLLSEIKLSDYDNMLGKGGTTALYDSVENGVSATATYGKQLTSNDYTVNGIVIAITDGADCASINTPNSVKLAVKAAMQTECLESIKTVLVGVNVADPIIGTLLASFKKDAGLDDYIEINNADPKSFARLQNWMSKSISATSQALSTGAGSKSLSF